MKHTLVIILLFTSFSLFSQNDFQRNHLLKDRFLIEAGIFSPLKQVKLGAEGNLTPDYTDDIDFSKSFKMEGIQNTLNLTFMWRFTRNRKWLFIGDYFKIGNENEAVLKEDIQWNDLIFKKGTGVKGGFGMSVYKIFFGHTICTGEKYEFGGGLGIHGLQTYAFIEGKALVNEDEYKYEKSKVSIVLPLPNVGLWYLYAPTEKLALVAHVNWFGIKIDNKTAVLWDISPGIRYQPFKKVGFTFHYKYLKLGADVNNKSWRGNFHMIFHGPSLMVSASF